MDEFISKHTTIGDIVSHYPEVLETMQKYHVKPDTEGTDSFETIEEFSKSSGLSDDETERMIEEMNEVIENKQQAEEDMFDDDDD